MSVRVERTIVLNDELSIEVDPHVVKRNREAVADGADGPAFDPAVFAVKDYGGRVMVWLTAAEVAELRVALAELLEKFADEVGEDWTPAPDPFLACIEHPDGTWTHAPRCPIAPDEHRPDDGPPV